MDLKDKKVLVCGLGITGMATLPLLLQKGAIVTVWTSSVSKGYESDFEKFKKRGVELFIMDIPNDIIIGFDLCVVSPGIPTDMSFFDLAEKNNIPVVSEIELSNWYFKGRLVGITGTNGKSTTSTLMSEIVKEQFKSSELLGNIGEAFSSKTLESVKDSVYTIELSSYQLECTYTIKPKVAAVLNISKDHLSRHKTMQNYIAQKKRIFMNQDENDFLVLNYDDDVTREMAKEAKSKVVFFSKEQIDEDVLCVYVKNDSIYTNFKGKEEVILAKSDILLIGEHNLENVLSAVAMSLALEIPISVIAYVISTFKGVEHRLEFVKIIHGVTFINDSKATNPDSSINAIKSVNQPIILIVGGYDKKLPLFEFVKEITKSVEHLVIIGDTTEKFVNCCNKIGYNNFVVCETLESAVEEGFKVAKPGDCVLLSPSCSSFDMFENFESRGKAFKKAINELRR
ncbi:MAG: UDP-N-acetylmuramoyl-L-alanine--D-glutamate ligase [Lachnospirales bacterium]